MPKVERHVYLAFLILGLTSLAVGTIGAERNRGQQFREGNWSKEAMELSIAAGEKRSLILYDPSGKREVKINYTDLAAKMPGGAEQSFQLYWLAELDWAADGNAFFVTESDGGPLGTWFVKSYSFDADRVVEADVSSLATRQFMKNNSCPDARPVVPNAMGITWLNGSKDVLLAVRVPFDVHTCGGNSVVGYRVNARSGAVEEELTFADLQRKWGRLFGRGFRDVRR